MISAGRPKGTFLTSHTSYPVCYNQCTRDGNIGHQSVFTVDLVCRLQNKLIIFLQLMKISVAPAEQVDLVAERSLSKNLRDVRKRIRMGRRNKLEGYETKLVENQTTSNEKVCLSDAKETAKIRNKGTVYETNQSNRSSIKLPSINCRASNRQNFEKYYGSAIEQAREGDELVEQKGVKNPKYGSQIKDQEYCEKDSDKNMTNFMNYIQIRSMKPAGKVQEPKTENHFRDKLNFRGDRMAQMNKTNERHALEKQYVQKSEKTMKVRRGDKSQTAISVEYSFKKEKKRVLSITQPVRKKITNSYWEYCDFLCGLNRCSRPDNPVGTYKAFIGKGNNSILIKNSLKNRFWWNIVEDSLDANLYWTQCRDKKFVENLRTHDSNVPGQSEIQEATKGNSKDSFIHYAIKKEENEKVDPVGEYVRTGLDKFLSNEERKRMSKDSYHVKLNTQDVQRKLGSPNSHHIHNHLEFFWHVSNKKALYYNLKKYYEATGQDPFQYIPLTFHIQNQYDSEWQNFKEHYEHRSESLKNKNEGKTSKKKKQKNLWIVKPGENSNQGCGIEVYDNFNDIADAVRNNQKSNGKSKSYIVQRYLMPFLYCKRKFDIRCFVLFTSVNGIYKAYWYEQGYIRTSSKQFTIKNLKNRLIHLTNDAVQKKSEDYSRYQNGNKVSFADFQKHLDNSYPEKEYRFYDSVYPKMIKMASDAIKSACMLMDAQHREFTFEIFGLDFMIDEDFDTWLIEVNTNPCLELSSPLLARIIPHMIENALRIAVDPLFPPPKDIPKIKTLPNDLFESNKFSLIFSSQESSDILMNLIKDTNLTNIVESDDEDEKFED